MRLLAKRLIEDATDPVGGELGIDDWIFKWCEENSSSLDIWGTEVHWEAIQLFVKRGTPIKVVSHPRQRNRLQKAGWTLFVEEYNPSVESWDSYEGILIKRN